jgi:hypothetical protein
MVGVESTGSDVSAPEPLALRVPKKAIPWRNTVHSLHCRHELLSSIGDCSDRWGFTTHPTHFIAPNEMANCSFHTEVNAQQASRRWRVLFKLAR